jgi:hypothetical protein
MLTTDSDHTSIRSWNCSRADARAASADLLRQAKELGRLAADARRRGDMIAVSIFGHASARALRAAGRFGGR